MGFEGFFKRKPKEEKMDTPEQKAYDKRQKKAGVAFAGTLGALGAVIAAQDHVPDLHQEPAGPEHKMSTHEQQAMHEMGPHGAQVSINPEAGQAVVTMRPPGEGKVVDINLAPKPPVSIDLSAKKVDIDLKPKVYKFEPPE